MSTSSMKKSYTTKVFERYLSSLHKQNKIGKKKTFKVFSEHRNFSAQPAFKYMTQLQTHKLIR